MEAFNSARDAQFSITLPVTLRLARASDLPAMEWHGEYTHFRAVYQRTYRDQQAGTRFMLLADLNGFPIGQIFGQWQAAAPGLFAPPRPARAYLYSFRVMEMFRGAGIGTALLRHAETLAREHGCGGMSIAAAKDNPRARTLYERTGYRVVGEDDGRWSYVDHNGRTRSVDEPCWVLEKSIKIR